LAAAVALAAAAVEDGVAVVEEAEGASVVLEAVEADSVVAGLAGPGRDFRVGFSRDRFFRGKFS
jgi:hypothetical protein